MPDALSSLIRMFHLDLAKLCMIDVDDAQDLHEPLVQAKQWKACNTQ